MKLYKTFHLVTDSRVSVSLRSYIHSYSLPTDFLESDLNTSVSVSLRSYIHSYTNKNKLVFTIYEQLVSVSLRSYIHSYTSLKVMNISASFESFRLLTELYSFLSLQ